MSLTSPDFSSGASREPATGASSQRFPGNQELLERITRQRVARAGGPGGGGGWSSPRRRALVATVGIAVIGVAGLLVYTQPWVSPGQDQNSLRPVSTKPFSADACLDSSASVDSDGETARRAADEIVRQVKALGLPLTLPVGTEPVEPRQALQLTARVVRSNSYETAELDRYVSRNTVPPVSGLAARPAVAAAVGDRVAWENARETVVRQRRSAAQALTATSARFDTILHRRSTGSDVQGCVGAALEASGTGTSPSILVVSDLEDRALTNPDGTARTFSGDWSSARVTIVRACPSGDQGRCDATGARFNRRLARLGITQVQTFRPEQLGQAVSTWLDGA